MQLSNTNSQRFNWTFNHTGSVLQPMAEALFQNFKQMEQDARERMGEMVADMKVGLDDPDLRKLQQDIIHYGELRTKCSVWAHEFGRTPDREFMLGLNDVGFFNGDRNTNGTNKREQWKYHYTAQELLPFVKQKIQNLLFEVNELSRAGKDGDRFDKARETEDLQLLKEQLEGQPENPLVLGMGDVVYFNMAQLNQEVVAE